ncbi:hypothetical protein BDQ12DRAFT_682595 [Crucibulum laeve]|uniref:Ubiquinol-cytochrome c chaperone domain-containing protein n=1 Tax=Crucibulum laeve TaxID=68775 RepID=A0A5C3M1I9_9AGAR|nr:hypothetical protein BDQ12DRAFT_682595 [Crucibulum laeve]
MTEVFFIYPSGLPFPHTVLTLSSIDCSLPLTFQSRFTITNLHIWLLTVHLRALPNPLGMHHTQTLIDHFFININDRIRAVLRPPTEPTKPYAFHADFYLNPNAPKEGELDEHGKQQKRPLLGVRTQDMLVTRQMKIFKKQWAGMGMSLHLGLVTSDMELAGVVWRNMLGARGMQDIA